VTTISEAFSMAVRFEAYSCASNDDYRRPVRGIEVDKDVASRSRLEDSVDRLQASVQ
jgi:hypothetical protein